ncbi:MAG TPA: polysaccharide biosynthesis/export family protein [Candidatus Acidoferrales bacterium]|nr:polysaccharide biosynthesis/export family protein [Candidatus Acidoferrales bacterium]
MRTGLSWAFFVFLISAAAVAQQEPPQPSQPKPPKTTEGQADRPADAKEAPAAPTPAGTPKADPARMAAPKGGPPKKGNAAVDDKSYVLGAEDQISVMVNNSQEFNGTHLIRPDGRITVNLVGEVEAAGLTPAELTESLKERIKKYILDPDVTVAVLSINSKRFFIQGEVNRPGEYKLVVPTKILEALVNAGGFRDFAKTKDIVVIREEGGNTERLHFNYKDVINGKHLEQNIYLKPGDIIVVR